ncbi:DUF3103 family protein [Psychromonas aquimarina]|uniref:DUF3103 family protein n=1 Tax=Psychromonas aquimarina TaxID=444919 RepID=UPI0004219EE2|nr:DUF3103 family protein [Psychromonas aquimarina]
MRLNKVMSALALSGLMFFSVTANAADADRELARSLALKAEQLLPKLANENYQSSLHNLLKQRRSRRSVSAVQTLANEADQRTVSRLGLEGRTDDLMQMRLATPDMIDRVKAGEEVLIAYVPSGNEREWSAVEAFDSAGNAVYLDVYEEPDVPVLVVEANAQKAHTAGIALVNEALQDAGLQAPRSARMTAMSSEPQTLKTSVLKKIRLNDDAEPWLLGKAESYAIVAGVSPSRDKPVVDIVDMPYLDYSEQTYSPNQTWIYWDRYRWGAVDVVLMEQDSNYNYQELATLLIEVLEKGLIAGGYPEAAPFLELASKIVKALPASWMTNDDDYVESFYTLEQDQSYQDYPGASGNAVITLEPKEINLSHN